MRKVRFLAILILLFFSIFHSIHADSLTDINTQTNEKEYQRILSLTLDAGQDAQLSSQSSDAKEKDVDEELKEFFNPPYTCMFCKTYGQTLLHDTKHILIFPTYFDREDWLIFGATAGGIVALTTVDRKIQRTIQPRRDNVTDTAAKIINPFGFQAAYAIMAGLYLHGVFADNPKSKIVALDAISSTLVSWGVISTFIKYTTGRSRPSEHEGRYHFEPFHEGNNSFPSGHTTQAFTLAAVLSSHYHRKAIIIPAYGLATLVALARMNDDKHWTSDVVGGALLGTLVGRELVVYNRRKRLELATKAELTLVPLIDERGRGLNLFFRFN